MPHSDSSARKHSIAFHSSHHYIYNSCCGWVTNLWKTSNWTGSRRAIPADSCLQHSWQQMANPATPPIFLISLLFLMLCGAFTKKKNFRWELALHEPSGQWQLRSGREVGWFAAVRIHNATQGCCEGICGLKQAYATPISSFLFISTHTYCKYLGFLSSLQQRTKNGQYSAIVKLRYRQRHDYCSCFPSLWDNKSQNFQIFQGTARARITNAPPNHTLRARVISQ